MDKINFQDLPSTETPINSSNLNLLQENVETSINTKINKSIPIPENANLNDYTTEGFYHCASSSIASTMINIPLSDAFSLLVEKHAGVKQTFTVFYPSKPLTYVRNCYDGVWGDWNPLYIETVENENGTAIKYPDGTMECFGRAINTAEGYCLVTFPVEFVEAPTNFMVSLAYGSYTKFNVVYTLVQSNNTTKFIIYFRNATGSATTDTTIIANWRAIGKWKE